MGKGPKQRIYVSPHWFEVKYQKDLAKNAGATGTCAEDEQYILIDPELGATVMRETMLHEILHAVWHQTELDNRYSNDEEEKIVWTLAPRLLALIRENPDLMTFLMEPDSPTSSRSTTKSKSSTKSIYVNDPSEIGKRG
jgi:hypothetical protein